ALELLVQERKTKAQNLLDNATIVELKKEQMIRIVLKNGMTLDFTELRGRLEDNLRERDFTMNALAWSPNTGISDPTHGINDIEKKLINAISMDNFRNDPLRLLRVYRFVSELGWDADSKTRRMVSQLTSNIKKSAPERITQEFFKLLNSKNYQEALEMALDDGLLVSFISSSRKRLSENIKGLSDIESQIRKLPPIYKNSVGKPFSQELTYQGLLRLEQVLSDSALNENKLRLSRSILKRLKIIHSLATSQFLPLTSSKMFDAFSEAKDALLDILILTGNIKLLKHAERFKKIWKKSFLTAEEIMKATGLKSGVELGKLIYRLKKMQFEEKLKTKKEAEKWLNSKDR
ncbi:MAG: CCA tRNA nucleotidyltransferase, partial [Nitrospirae bacterium]|nr:CCA tRNA nucleotidyltransferase [Nitrospirota bacterium]